MKLPRTMNSFPMHIGGAVAYAELVPVDVRLAPIIAELALVDADVVGCGDVHCSRKIAEAFMGCLQFPVELARNALQGTNRKDNVQGCLLPYVQIVLDTLVW